MKQCLWTHGRIIAALLVAVVSSAVLPVAWAGVADYAQVQYDLVAALEKQGNRSEAIAKWQSLLTKYAHNPGDAQLCVMRAGTIYAIGEAQRQSDHLDAAQTSFSKVLSDYPQCRSHCVDATIGIAKVFQKKEEYPNALRYYAKVLSDYSERITRADFARANIPGSQGIYGRFSRTRIRFDSRH